LKKAGEGKWDTEESEFIRILCTHSFPQLNDIFEHYAKCGKDIEKLIKNEMSGAMELGCLAIS
jgi:hypothetical protein